LQKRTKRAERKGPQALVKLWSAHDHELTYAVFGSSPLWHPGHQ
jgi:hypothetical protein